MRHRIKRKTLGKEPRRMSKSIIESLTGNAAAPELEIVVAPTADVSQGDSDVLATADNKQVISPNSLCRYLNLRMQLANTSGTGDAGWYEYAVVLQTEQTGTPTIGSTFSTVNTNTVGDIAINRFRGKCLWNGAVPINDGQSKVLELSLKIPDKWCKWIMGQYLTLIHHYRQADSMNADPLTVVWSSQWKCYL